MVETAPSGVFFMEEIMKYEADGRTAWQWRNGTRTQKKQFPTEADCSSWVDGMNPKPVKTETKSGRKTKTKG